MTLTQCISYRIAMLTLLFGVTDALAIDYSIRPLTLTDGYSVVGGTITTDGTTGPLDSSNILDWDVIVLSPSALSFSPSSPGAEVTTFGNLTATDTRAS